MTVPSASTAPKLLLLLRPATPLAVDPAADDPDPDPDVEPANAVTYALVGAVDGRLLLLLPPSLAPPTAPTAPTAAVAAAAAAAGPCADP